MQYLKELLKNNMFYQAYLEKKRKDRINNFLSLLERMFYSAGVLVLFTIILSLLIKWFFVDLKIPTNNETIVVFSFLFMSANLLFTSLLDLDDDE